MNKRLIFIVFVALSVGACSGLHKKANRQAVEKLNNQFRQENYDEMYQQTSGILKRSISKEEFISKVRNMHEEMKNVDENLIWREDGNAHFDEGVFPDDNFSYRVMLKNGKQLQIQIDWNSPFQLCGLQVLQDPNDGIGTGFRYCD